MIMKKILFFLVLPFLWTSCNEEAGVSPKFYPFVVSAEFLELNMEGVTLKAQFVEGVDKVVEYGFCFGLTEASTKNKYGPPLLVEVNGTQFSCRVEGPAIKGNQTYYFRPFLKTESGFVVYGPMSSFVFEGPGHQVADIDGNLYNTVQLGSLIWTTENLRVTHFNNGDPILTDLNNSQWNNMNEGAYAFYPFEQVNGLVSEEEMKAVYGALYNWYAVTDARGLCPAGWRVPNDDDWKYLEGYADSEYGIGHYIWDMDSSLGRGEDAGSKLKLFKPFHWYLGNDDFGFSATLGGIRRQHGAFEGEWKRGFFWSATGRDEWTAWWRGLTYNSGKISRQYWHKTVGGSVRCVKDGD